jgi:hypothetical protein
VCTDVGHIADKICDAHCSDKRKTLYYYISLALWNTVINSCHREKGGGRGRERGERERGGDGERGGERGKEREGQQHYIL